MLADTIHRFGHQDVQFVGPVSEVATRLCDVVRPGDLVLTLGAGHIWQAGEELLVYLRRPELRTGGRA